MKDNVYPPGWDERRVREVIDYYENQTDEEAAAEADAAFEAPTETMMSVPNDLVPAVRELIARRQSA